MEDLLFKHEQSETYLYKISATLEKNLQFPAQLTRLDK